MARRQQDQENHLRDIKRQLSEQLSCLDIRTESKNALLSEMQDFLKRRGDAEFEYAKSLERLCERFERSIKQRGIKHEVRSIFNLWSTMLAETRRMARDRANLAEVMAVEMTARLDIMMKDVAFIAKKCREVFGEVQDTYSRELKELSEQTKVYQYTCHHCMEAHGKLVKSKERVDSIKNPARRKKAEEKEKERRRQYNEQKHRQLKHRNDYLLRLSSCNARMQCYYSADLMELIKFMDFDYHDSFHRLAQAYYEAEHEACQQVMQVSGTILDQAKTLNFENDLHYFLSEFSAVFSHPGEFNYLPYGDDDVVEYKVNTKDVFLRAQEMSQALQGEINTLEVQKEEDSKTVSHMTSNNLLRYKVVSVNDAIKLIEEAGESVPPETSKSSSLDRGNLPTSTRSAHALHVSQKGKKDTLTFTTGVFQRMLLRSSTLEMCQSRLKIVEHALSQQKVPPVSIGGDYRVPKLFGGDCLEYIMATGTNIPLVVHSCCQAIRREGLSTEGIFRVPGPAQHIEDLRKGFEEGRDPLTYSSTKVDITAVASVLKMYFRELSTPLFPTTNYYDFIKCSRQETVELRIDSIRDCVNKLHPAVVTVMRYLFKFLFDVAQYAAVTKMSSANLALVFGPTLTRAPDNANPHMLHNDVPAINVLIQLCIERHLYIFGEEDEEDRLSSPPPPPVDPILCPPPPPVENEDEPVVSSPEVCYPPSPDSSPPDPCSQEDIEPPPRPPPPASVPAPAPVPAAAIAALSAAAIQACGGPTPAPEVAPPPPEKEEANKDEEKTKEPSPEAKPVPEETPAPVEPIVPPPIETMSPQVQSPVHSLPPSVAVEPPTPAPTDNENKSLTLNELDEALKEIDNIIEEGSPPIARKGEAEQDEEEEGELADDDGETDTEDEEEVMTMNARALYDYSARNEKELTFSQGDVVEVVEKTPDGNWWHGFNKGVSGYIPVSYVEITEILAVPTPPLRRSSMQKPDPPDKQASPPTPDVMSPTHAQGPPLEVVAEEGKEEVDKAAAEKKVEVEKIEEKAEVKLDVKPPEQIIAESKPKTEAPASPPSPSISTVKDKPKKVNIPVAAGSVSKLKQRFKSQEAQPPPPPPPQKNVLAGPHGHTSQYRRLSAEIPSRKEGEPHPRSNSGASALRSTHPPPPIKPKPPGVSDRDAPAPAFPIMSHDSHVSASPLQKAHLQQQQASSKPTNVKKSGAFKSSYKKKDGAGRPPIPSKPAAPPTPPQAQFQAELRQQLIHRKHEDDRK